MTDPTRVSHTRKREEQFRPGVYRHYKGGYYVAVALAWANEVSEPRERVVVYISMTTGDYYTRPYNSVVHDAWNDEVCIEDASTSNMHTAAWVPRFEYVGVQTVVDHTKAPIPIKIEDVIRMVGHMRDAKRTAAGWDETLRDLARYLKELGGDMALQIRADVLSVQGTPCRDLEEAHAINNALARRVYSALEYLRSSTRPTP